MLFQYYLRFLGFPAIYEKPAITYGRTEESPLFLDPLCSHPSLNYSPRPDYNFPVRQDMNCILLPDEILLFPQIIHVEHVLFIFLIQLGY